MPISEFLTKAGDRFQAVPIALKRGDGSVRDISGDGLTTSDIFVNLQDTADASIRLIGDTINTIVDEATGQLAWRPSVESVTIVDGKQRRWEIEVEIVHPGGLRETFPVRDEDRMFLIVNPDIGNA